MLQNFFDTTEVEIDAQLLKKEIQRNIVCLVYLGYLMPNPLYTYV